MLRERGPASNVVPAPTEGTASVEPASVAERAAAARPEALETKADTGDEHRRGGSPQNDPTVRKDGCGHR
jgi:hypothetical protein